MALLTLPRFEACAIDFIDLWPHGHKMPSWISVDTRELNRRIRTRSRGEARIEVAVKEVGYRGYEGPFIFLDMEAMDADILRSALPTGYAVEDDGRLLRTDDMGYTPPSVTLAVNLLTEGNIVIGSSQGRDDSRWFTVWVGYEKETMLATAYTLSRHVDDGHSVPLHDLAATLVYQGVRGSVRSECTKPLLRMEKDFLKAFRPIDGYVRNSLSSIKDAKKKVRNVVLDTEEDDSFSPEDMLATRCTNGGSSFVRLGLKWDRQSGTVRYADYARKEGTADLNNHKAMALVHKAGDGWRFVFMLPMFYRASGIFENRLEMMPVFYMIPVFVSRHEVTFATVTFRGLKLTTQRRIWEVDGMSMAMNHALMSLTNQIKRMPTRHVISGRNPRVPSNHRVAMLGTGRCSLLPSSESVKEALERSDPGSDGPYRYSVYNSRYRVQFTRAVDILDHVFWSLPHNAIKPGPAKAPLPVAPKVCRSVRL